MNGPYDPFRARLDGASRNARAGGLFSASSPIGKVLGIAVGAVAVIAAMAMSVIALGAILVVGLVGGVWFWWRTRDLRRQLKAEMARMQQMGGVRPATSPDRAPQGGEVIDGDFIREAPAPADPPQPGPR